MAAALKVLILGGYGTFGGRLAQLLADEPRLNLLIAGRSQAKAEEFRRALGGKVQASPLVFDREGDVEQQLASAAPDIVVDASGPFQAYGDAYRVIRACVARGVHYLDLADGSDFVKGVAAFDAEAKARNVFVLSGVSSFPVLTAAVVRKLSEGLTRIDTLSGGIAPSPYAGVGLNVIRAIASYAGRPIELIDGKHYALTETKRYTIAAPGRLPLHPILFSLVDVPDLKVLPDLWPSLRPVWMGAGPVPEILHRTLIVLAWLVRLRLLPTLYPFAPMMFRVINVLRWGEHRGGMFVEIEGLDEQGKPVTRSWHMVAEKNDGPFIPSMAAEAIIRHSLDGRSPLPGARPATHELELSDYDALFARRQIYAGFRVPLPDGTPLYQRALGDAWHALPKPLQELHGLKDTLVAEGRAVIVRGDGPIAKLIANLFGFPNAGQDVPVRVSFRLEDGREIWHREFDGRVMQSTQEEGQGRFERLICERFGPFAFGLALVLRDGRLHIAVRRWTAFGVPMPLAWAPGGDAYESADDGRFNFHVEIGLPLIGMIVRYRGWLLLRAP